MAFALVMVSYMEGVSHEVWLTFEAGGTHVKFKLRCLYWRVLRSSCRCIGCSCMTNALETQWHDSIDMVQMTIPIGLSEQIQDACLVDKGI